MDFKYDRHNKYHRLLRQILIIAVSLVMFIEAWWVISIIANSPTVPNPADTFIALKEIIQHGDSMTGIGIMDGDVIIARQCESAENGEIVVALVDDEATVKRFYNMGDHIELRAENPGFPPLPPYREVTVLGKVVANFRYYE